MTLIPKNLWADAAERRKRSVLTWAATTRDTLAERLAVETRLASTIDWFYRDRGLAPPQEKIWVKSPLRSCEIAAEKLASGQKLIMPQFQFFDEAALELKRAFSSQFGSRLGNDLIIKDVISPIFQPAEDKIRYSQSVVVRAASQEGGDSWANTLALRWAAAASIYTLEELDLYWEILGPSQNIRSAAGGVDLRPSLELSREYYWWCAFESSVVLCHRPQRIIFNGNWELHSENGPAIQFADGFSVWAENGEFLRSGIFRPVDPIVDPERFSGLENLGIDRTPL